MTLSDLQREVALLPCLTVAEESGEASATAPTPVDVASRQGKLILRLTATVETLDGRVREMSARLGERDGVAAALTAELSATRQDAERKTLEASRQTLHLAREAIHALDALDWVCATLESRGDAFAAEVARARVDCLKRLAAVGVTEVPADGPPDGRLHESVDTVETDAVPRYHIVSVVRRGYQWGMEVLRRAEVITAA